MNYDQIRSPNFLSLLSGAGPLMVLVLLALGLFWRPIVAETSLFGSDFIFHVHPLKKYLYDYVRSHGALPLWNPYLFSGTPYLANIQTAMFYPAGALFYLLPTELAYIYTAILHTLLAGGFMYLLARSLGLGRQSAMLSGIVFMLNGYFLGHLYAGHLTLIQSYVWIPLIFYFFHRFLRELHYSLAVVAGVLVGVQILGGFPQLAAYTLMALVLFALYQAWPHLRSNGRLAGKKVLGLILTLAVGLALAAAQLLPTFELAGLSNRAGTVSYAFATLGSYHPKDLLTLLMPDLFGNPIDNTYWRGPGVWSYWETCAYAGMLPLFLSFVAPDSHRHRSVRTFCLALLLLTIALAMGEHNPLYPLIHRLPGFNTFRNPGRILYLSVFSLSLLSGIGLEQLTEKRKLSAVFLWLGTGLGAIVGASVLFLHFLPGRFFSFLFLHLADQLSGSVAPGQVIDRISHSVDHSALLLATAILIFLGYRTPRIRIKSLSVLVLLVTMVDLYMFGSQFVIPYKPADGSVKKELLTDLTHQPPRGRLITCGALFSPNDGLLYGFPSLTGYDSLILKRYTEYILASQDRSLLPDHVVNLSAVIDHPEARLLRYLNLTGVLDSDGANRIEPLMPYASLVPRALVMPGDQILAAMRNERFDPGQVVLLEQQTALPTSLSPPSGDFNSACTVRRWDNESIQIETVTNQHCFLVINEMFYPGWQIQVDGHRAPLYRGNYLFCAAPIEPGTHTVLLRFVSWPFRIGALISLLALSAAIPAIIRACNSSRRKPIIPIDDHSACDSHRRNGNHSEEVRISRKSGENPANG